MFGIGYDEKAAGPTDAQKFHGERVEARQRERATTPQPHPSKVAFDKLLAEMFATVIVADLIRSLAPTPFEIFWLDLNKKLAAAGRPEALYGDAKDAFQAHQARQRAAEQKRLAAMAAENADLDRLLAEIFAFRPVQTPRA